MKFTYPAIIRKQDNGTWKAWLPDLACCEAVGDTLDDAIEEAQEHGVTVYRDIDKSKFIEAVQPMHEAFESKGDAYKSLYEDIQKYAVAEEEEK